MPLGRPQPHLVPTTFDPTQTTVNEKGSTSRQFGHTYSRNGNGGAPVTLRSVWVHNTLRRPATYLRFPLPIDRSSESSPKATHTRPEQRHFFFVPWEARTAEVVVAPAAEREATPGPWDDGDVSPRGATSSPAPNPGATRTRALYISDNKSKKNKDKKKMSGRATVTSSPWIVADRYQRKTVRKAPGMHARTQQRLAVLVVATEKSPSGQASYAAVQSFHGCGTNRGCHQSPRYTCTRQVDTRDGVGRCVQR
jgi:hypothetical protein